MISRRDACFLALFACLPCWTYAASADGELWTRSFEEARARAEEEGKSILMDFTGSDWCPPCKVLAKNVFSTDEFKAEAPKHYVLLLLDFPNDKSQQSPQEIEQNPKLKDKYNVSGFPTILLTDQNGVPFAKLAGYDDTPVAEYVAELTRIAGIRKQRDELFAQAERAEGIAKAKLLDQALSLLDAEVAASAYSDTIQEIMDLDATDATGLKTKYEKQLNRAKVQTVIDDIRQSGDLDESIAKLDALINELNLGDEVLQEVLYEKGYTFFRKGEKEESKSTLEAAQKLAPESDRGKQIGRILANLFK